MEAFSSVERKCSVGVDASMFLELKCLALLNADSFVHRTIVFEMKALHKIKKQKRNCCEECCHGSGFEGNQDARDVLSVLG